MKKIFLKVLAITLMISGSQVSQIKTSDAAKKTEGFFEGFGIGLAGVTVFGALIMLIVKNYVKNKKIRSKLDIREIKNLKSQINLNDLKTWLNTLEENTLTKIGKSETDPLAGGKLDDFIGQVGLIIQNILKSDDIELINTKPSQTKKGEYSEWLVKSSGRLAKILDEAYEQINAKTFELQGQQFKLNLSDTEKIRLRKQLFDAFVDGFGFELEKEDLKNQLEKMGNIYLIGEEITVQPLERGPSLSGLSEATSVGSEGGEIPEFTSILREPSSSPLEEGYGLYQTTSRRGSLELPSLSITSEPRFSSSVRTVEPGL